MAATISVPLPRAPLQAQATPAAGRGSLPALARMTRFAAEGVTQGLAPLVVSDSSEARDPAGKTPTDALPRGIQRESRRNENISNKPTQL